MNLEKLIGTIKPLLKIGLESLSSDKEKAAATVAGLPVCFEYGYIAGKAYIKPDLPAVKEYLTHIRAIWSK